MAMLRERGRPSDSDEDDDARFERAIPNLHLSVLRLAVARADLTRSLPREVHWQRRLEVGRPP